MGWRPIHPILLTLAAGLAHADGAPACCCAARATPTWVEAAPPADPPRGNPLAVGRPAPVLLFCGCAREQSSLRSVLRPSGAFLPRGAVSFARRGLTATAPWAQPFAVLTCSSLRLHVLLCLWLN
jgi:hypothetical protein